MLKKYSQVTSQYKIYRKRLKKQAQPKEGETPKPAAENQQLTEEEDVGELDSYEFELDEMEVYNGHRSKIELQKKIN